ncbi:alkylhydroperoxidase domain protein [Corynebacterium hylobatis]|uniref:Alkylhydroperoxidase domain protein n=1 Tax=Corynebacterium hylobatis TaxID=1859290 RepID=A0A430HXY2_9CORY|nr:alkylhydroperoxidase domain protein [Corynebacterium hylobatis]RSZ63149.1 alkylhydroperoxidase domain protein [Corynebacterium hylobatis]
MTDIINLLSALGPDHPLARLRGARPDALTNAQNSFEALLEPAAPGTFSYGERYAVATYVAGLHGAANARTFYSELLLDDAPATLPQAVDAAIEAGRSTGPYWDGGFVLHDADALGERLAAAFDIAHLLVFHPRDARPEAMAHLAAHGWSADDTVSLTQLISFLAFQLRVIHGLQVLAGRDVAVPAPARASGVTPDWQLHDDITTYPDLDRPSRFVRHSLGWKAWVAPVPKAELTQAQLDSLIRPERADMAYFRLLARDPDALKARTLTDLDIFYNTDGGLSRAERELAATVASRYNGCEYCASVHSVRSVEEGGDAESVDKLLDEGHAADLGDERWNAIREASVALTTTPVSYGAEHVAKLREVGLDDASLIDHLYATAFFNWANRLMLVLGEAEVPARFRD